MLIEIQAAFGSTPGEELAGPAHGGVTHATVCPSRLSPGIAHASALGGCCCLYGYYLRMLLLAAVLHMQCPRPPAGLCSRPVIGCCPSTVLDWLLVLLAGSLGAGQYHVGSHTVLPAVNCACFVCGGLHAQSLLGGYALVDPIWWGTCESAMAEMSTLRAVNTLRQRDCVGNPRALPDPPAVSRHFSSNCHHSCHLMSLHAASSTTTEARRAGSVAAAAQCGSWWGNSQCCAHLFLHAR